VHNEVKAVWKEAVVKSFDALYPYLHGGTEENHLRTQPEYSTFRPIFDAESLKCQARVLVV
jgi:hypothetical protein